MDEAEAKIRERVVALGVSRKPVSSRSVGGRKRRGDDRAVDFVYDQPRTETEGDDSAIRGNSKNPPFGGGCRADLRYIEGRLGR